MAKTVYDVLMEKLTAHAAAVADSVASGAAKDYAEYRAMCGEIRGLLTAERYVNDLAKHMETSDE